MPIEAIITYSLRGSCSTDRLKRRNEVLSLTITVYFIMQQPAHCFVTISMMNFTTKIPYYRDDDNELLGFIVDDGSSWQALTIFGYQIARTEKRIEAEAILKEKGLTFLKGVWQYYDKDDHDWFPCVIKHAYEQKVIVNRTTTLGYQDPEDYKQVVIERPTENELNKSA